MIYLYKSLITMQSIYYKWIIFFLLKTLFHYFSLLSSTGYFAVALTVAPPFVICEEERPPGQTRSHNCYQALLSKCRRQRRRRRRSLSSSRKWSCEKERQKEKGRERQRERCETEARALNKLGYEFTSTYTHTHTHSQGTCTWRNVRGGDDIMCKEYAPKGAPWRAALRTQMQMSQWQRQMPRPLLPQAIVDTRSSSCCAAKYPKDANQFAVERIRYSKYTIYPIYPMPQSEKRPLNVRRGRAKLC